MRKQQNQEMNTTMNTHTLIDYMNKSRNRINSDNNNRFKKNRVSLELDISKTKYLNFTNLSRTEKFTDVKKQIKQKKIQWNYQFYQSRSCFSKLDKTQLEQYPDNNKKIRIQFLPRSYRGDAMKTPMMGLGYFPKARRSLYSKHYQPIYDEKLKYNEDYQLRASLFGDIQLDAKRDRIIDQYKLQANPFKTQKSNQLLWRLKRIPQRGP